MIFVIMPPKRFLDKWIELKTAPKKNWRVKISPKLFLYQRLISFDLIFDGVGATVAVKV